MEPEREPPTALADLAVLLLDAQATAANPAAGALIEIGWARGSAASPPASGEITSLIVAPSPETAMPRAVARITGIDDAAWQRGVAADAAWGRLVGAAARVGAAPVPLVVHFARFEQPHLRALHGRHGHGPFPFELLCTHAIARRLLPGLPRCTLRALAGYFGAGVPPLRRSADHVAATAFVWRHLVDALAREEIRDLPALREWLTRPAPRPGRAGRTYPLARQRRRELPKGPGVYRLLREGGGIVYVGKATSLRLRVSGHYHAALGERALELLSQVREVSCTETATALEAALLESDEIKRLSPPYNRALTATDRSVWYVTAALDSWRESPDEEHDVGPLPSPLPFEALAALRAALATDRPAPLPVRARAVGVDASYAPGAECFTAGLAGFAARHGRLPSARAALRVGARLWNERRAAATAAAEGPAAEQPASARARPGWDADRVREALEEMVARAAHAVRRARWLARLSESTIAWSEATRPGVVRLLRIERGAVAAREDVAPGATLPAPEGGCRSPAARRAAFDVSTFDRLRVLTTELRTLVVEAPHVEIRIGEHARLSRRRLQAVLRWV